MYSSANFSTELKAVQNSVIAYINVVDCSKKTPAEIANDSFNCLHSCFHEVFFEEQQGAKSFMMNASRALGAITSLGGSYVLALEKKHYSDVYEALYMPNIEELTQVHARINKLLDQIGDSLGRYRRTMQKVEKLLKKVSTRKIDASSRKIAPLYQIRKFNTNYNSVFTNGFGGLIGGSTAIGAWGVVSMIGSASTGAAISSLSGIAATNATLAWFGGGAISAGGAGMSGGFLVLGGIVAAPLIYFSTTSSYKKVEAIKTEKAKLFEELEKLPKLNAEANQQVISLTCRSVHIKTLIDEVIPKLDGYMSEYKSNSSIIFRVFGGQVNEAQKSAVEAIEKISLESITKLGF